MITKHKRIDCKYYERCLDDAAKQNWTQFHCGGCTAYEAEVVDITALPRSAETAYFNVRYRS